MIDPVRLLILHRFEVIDAESLERIVEDLQAGTARASKWLWLTAPLGILGFVALAGFLYFTGDAAERADLILTIKNPIIFIPAILFPLLVPWMQLRQVRSGKLRRVMLRHRRCPYCGYDIRTLVPSAEDGCTICPECGCAWRLEDADTLAGADGADALQRRKRILLVITGLVLAFLALLGLFFAR